MMDQYDFQKKIWIFIQFRTAVTGLKGKKARVSKSP
jgi:hypothetical protein